MSGAAIVLLVALIAAARAEDAALCPDDCECLGDMVDCGANCGQNELPQDLPEWTRVLDVSGCRISEERWASLSTLPLRKLIAARANFTGAPFLTGFERLEELNLEGNKIAELVAGSLPDLPALRSLRLRGNKLAELKPGVFDAMPALVDLRLDANKLTHLPKLLFREQHALELLDLSGNRLREIDDLVFCNLTRLTKLKLRRNEIDVLRDGAFYGLNSTSTLELDRNNISVVSKGWTFGLSSLKTLSLSRNRIETLQTDCWECCSRLEILDLSDNSLAVLTGRSLEHLDGLKTLRLDGNRISIIADRAFRHTPSLERLRLERNEIQRAIEDAIAPFSGLRHLKTLSLARNRFKSVGERALVGLESLSELDLDGNTITALHKRAFDTLPKLEELRLDAVGLLCDCDLRWLPARAQQLARPESLAATCAFPQRLLGKRVTALNRDDFACAADSPKPRIVLHPESNKQAIRGGTFALECSAASSASSDVTFVWRRNELDVKDRPLENRASFDNGTTKATSKLVISNASDYDAGKYKCVASNEYGAAYSRIARVSVVVYPRFIKKPADVTVRAGETAKLECSAAGDPKPQIAWQKDEGDDFPAARERRMHMIDGDDAFFIVNSKPSDVGVYSCTAKNAAGSVASNATLNVLEAPSFVAAMENKEVAAGESVVIECMVSGSPKPSLRWLKDGAPIIATERHFFTAENQLLIVVNAMSADEGLYECEIENELGTMRDATELRVSPPAQPSVEEDTTGIVVIAVVCCAVGTSVVWVVIIYQTRKRMKRAVARYTSESPPQIPLVPTLDLDQERPRIFSDEVSERSSCKDSGTGDSAKRGSIELAPIEDPVVAGTDIVTVYATREESRALLERGCAEGCECGAAVRPHGDADPRRTFPYS